MINVIIQFFKESGKLYTVETLNVKGVNVWDNHEIIRLIWQEYSMGMDFVFIASDGKTENIRLVTKEYKL